MCNYACMRWSSENIDFLYFILFSCRISSDTCYWLWINSVVLIIRRPVFLVCFFAVLWPAYRGRCLLISHCFALLQFLGYPFPPRSRRAPIQMQPIAMYVVPLNFFIGSE